MWADTLSEAPRQPGIYLFLTQTGEPLYVGKAKDLRKRLASYRKPKWPADRFLDDTTRLTWVVCASEADALEREADIVVALNPLFNAAMSYEDFTFVALAGERFVLSTDRSVDGAVFGGFPHLGKGKGTATVVRSNAGYSALLRCIWTACSTRPVPARLRGSSPPVDHRSPMPEDVREVHGFLSGRSDKLLVSLQPAIDDGLVRRGFDADLELAASFFASGPKRIRALARRHSRRMPIDRRGFADMIAADLRDATGHDIHAEPRTLDPVERRMSRAQRAR